LSSRWPIKCPSTSTLRKANAKYVAGILADAENKHAKNSIKRGTLSKASFLQGLGNMLTEPFLRDFQEHGNGKIYAILEVQGEGQGHCHHRA
jgi:hypothetical protein